MYHRVGEKRSYDDICIEDDACVESLGRCGDRSLSPKAAMEHEKRIRREIANSNERRRMQSINAGFASLKSLLPKQEGEKLSKAAILQHTADYVYQLEQEKTRLLTQNCQLKRLLNNHQQKEFDGNQSGGDSPREDRINSVENVTTLLPLASASPDPALEDLKRELTDCKRLLDHERNQRIKYEEYVKAVEGQIFSEKEPAKKEISKQPGWSFVVTKSKDFKMDSFAPKVITEMAPVVQHPQILPLKPIRSSEELIIKEEEHEVNTDTLNSINCHVSHQPIALYENNLSTKRVDNQENTIIPPSGTIVTVVSSKPNKIMMPPTTEMHRGNDIEIGTPPAEESNIDDNSTVYIMNTNNSACQKSLDTICEAIRHLEGDHMFPMEDQQSHLEEEVVTEETYTVEEEFPPQSVPQDHLESQPEIVKFATTVSSHSLYASHPPSSHPIGGSMSNLTLQMLPNEPQEVPLELTTHRVSDCVDSRSMTSETLLSHHSSTRPGVIVVKHT